MKKLLLMICLSLPLYLLAQGPYEMGVTLNGWNYMGDMVPNNAPYMEEVKPGVALMFRHTFMPNLAWRAELAYGSVSGNDRNFEERLNSNPLLDFETSLFYVGGAMEWHIFGRERRSLRVYNAQGERIPFEELKTDGSVTYYDGEGLIIERRLRLKRSVSPYLSLGVGAVFFDPTISAYSENGRTLTQKELDQDYAKVNISTPIGGGLKIYLNEKWALMGEALFLPLYSDYIDGASDSRNPKNNDWLSRFNIGLTYHFHSFRKGGE